MAHLAVLEDCAGRGSAVLARVDGSGLVGSDTDDWREISIGFSVGLSEGTGKGRRFRLRMRENVREKEEAPTLGETRLSNEGSGRWGRVLARQIVGHTSCASPTIHAMQGKTARQHSTAGQIEA